MADMLINLSTISYATEQAGAFTEIPSCTNYPGFSGNPNKIDISIINSDVKHSALGQKDPGDVRFTFLCGTDAETAAFFKFRELELAGDVVYFQVKFKDDLTVEFNGTVAASLMPDGGGPDGVRTWAMTVGLLSDFTYKKGTASG